MNVISSRIVLLLLTGVLAVAPCVAAQPSKAKMDLASIKASENKGRPGSYNCKTAYKDCEYWVYVPKSYSADNPAGMHIYFHGMGGARSAEQFQMWAQYFLEPYNLIGINMQYLDNSPKTGVAEKTAAARQAFAQTMADYKIIAGRGVICSFSAGGNPHSMWYTQSAKNRGDEWPFCHSAIYSSAISAKPNAHAPMSWCWVIGEKEFNLGGPQICQLVATLLPAPTAPAPPEADVRVMVMKNKGHGFDFAEVFLPESAGGFRRSDLSAAPFLYEPDYPEPELAPLAKQANKLLYAGLLPALDRVLKASKSEALTAKAMALKARIAARIKAVMELAAELCANDPVLANFYCRKFIEQLNGLPECVEIKKMMSDVAAQKDFQKLCAFPGQLKEKLSKDMFGPTAQLNTAYVPLLEDIKATANPKSQLGRVAAEYLQLK